jgi:hypothetical protein
MSGRETSAAAAGYPSSRSSSPSIFQVYDGQGLLDVGQRVRPVPDPHRRLERILCQRAAPGGAQGLERGFERTGAIRVDVRDDEASGEVVCRPVEEGGLDERVGHEPVRHLQRAEVARAARVADRAVRQGGKDLPGVVHVLENRVDEKRGQADALRRAQNGEQVPPVSVVNRALAVHDHHVDPAEHLPQVGRAQRGLDSVCDDGIGEVQPVAGEMRVADDRADPAQHAPVRRGHGETADVRLIASVVEERDRDGRACAWDGRVGRGHHTHAGRDSSRSRRRSKRMISWSQVPTNSDRPAHATLTGR